MTRFIKIVALICAAALFLIMFTSCQKSQDSPDSSDVYATEAEKGADAASTPREPSTEGAASLPESESAEDIALSGASSLNDLEKILADDFLFSEQQVRCMSQEFLFACIYICDPDNAAKIYEKNDIAAITELLNEKLFSVIGKNPVQYTVSSYKVYEINDELRAQIQDFFMQSYDQVVEQYGEYYVQKVSEENKGRQKMIALEYTSTDKSGNSETVSADENNALVFMVVNGRYYWNNFGLFQSLDINAY